MKYKAFVGIDQSKKTIDVVLISNSNPDGSHCQFCNNKKGLKEMIKWINSLVELPLNEILFCSEHTGLYSWPLCIFLNSLQLDLWLESPLQIKLSAGLKRGKNDKADAKEIALYAFLHWRKARLFQLPPKDLLALKHLLAFRTRLIKFQTALKISSSELKEFKADQNGIIGKESMALIKSISNKIKIIDEQMLQLIGQNHDLKHKFNLIKSVYGVGKQTALSILVYTNAFTLFDDWRKFACYCGIAPFKHTSGTSIRGKTRISHLANKKLKTLLTMCALNTLKKDNEFKTYYDRRINDGKSKSSTLNVLRNKIVSRIFASVKRGTSYQPILHQVA